MLFDISSEVTVNFIVIILLANGTLGVMPNEFAKQKGL